jgi:hypothetical protein
MAKEKDINGGFKVGDVVKPKKSTTQQGRIKDFEWSGVRRALVETGESNNALYVWGVDDIELVSRMEEPVPITKTEADIKAEEV